MPARRLWLFRIVAMVILPAAILGGMELVLRLAGYGHPTNFFVRETINGTEFHVPNEFFGYRFFPPALARTPLMLRVAAHKPPGTFRIFLFGESAAQGDPDPTFGAGRYLQTLLNERYPGTHFEVICVAMTAINSHAILPIARECARHEGDLWVIYMGNNEMVGPFGPSTVFGPRAPKTGLVRFYLAAKATRLGQWMMNVTGHFRAKSEAPKTWTGLDMFKQHQLAYDDAGRLRAYDNFRKNLADILKAARRADVPVLLSTVGSNLKNCAPFASLHAATMTDAQQTEWNGYYETGKSFEAAGQYPEALAEYAKAAALDPHYAEVEFRMGNCELAVSNAVQALRDYTAARDDDALVFRTDSRINQIIRDAAAPSPGQKVTLLDAAQWLNQQSPDGISGHELFYEHVHLNFAGNYLLGRAFAEETARLLPETITAQGRSGWAAAEVCDQRLAVSLWDQFRVWQENYSRVSEPPFTDQIDAALRTKFYQAKLNELKSRISSTGPEAAKELYTNAVARNPDDYLLHGNYAQFLAETGDYPAAIREQQLVGGFFPQDATVPYRLGCLFVRTGDTAAAMENFTRALALRADDVPALNEEGEILANQHKNDEAAKVFARALAINSGSFQADIDWGFMLQMAGQLDRAQELYSAAAALQPSGPAALYLQAFDAAQQHQRDDAINHYRACVWMDPSFWQAHYLLAMEWAAVGKFAEAEAQLNETVRLRPDFALGHLNLGVALAKERKYGPALKEFQKALQLNPADEVARKNVDALQAVAGPAPAGNK